MFRTQSQNLPFLQYFTGHNDDKSTQKQVGENIYLHSLSNRLKEFVVIFLSNCDLLVKRKQISGDLLLMTFIQFYFYCLNFCFWKYCHDAECRLQPCPARHWFLPFTFSGTSSWLLFQRLLKQIKSTLLYIFGGIINFCIIVNEN